MELIKNLTNNIETLEKSEIELLNFQIKWKLYDLPQINMSFDDVLIMKKFETRFK